MTKNDVTGRPADVDIEIANKSRDIAGSISELQDRTRINEVYAQGATNQMIVPFADNADNENPALMRIYIPDTMERINKLVLNYQLEPFRAYSKAIEGGGGTVASTSAGGATTQTSSSGGGGATTSSSGGGGTTTSDQSDVREIWQIGTGMSGDMMVPAGPPPGHVHPLDRHSHPHKHVIAIPTHSHDIQIRDHQHSINIPNHQHSIKILDHTHELKFGIYRGPTADRVTIKVDGKSIPQSQPGEDIDIVKYLSTDNAGKIQRNTWHTVEIVPNKMTRVMANIFMQIFTNSRGGGDY